MTAPSLPMILFAVADAVARGGMPEPAEVRISDNGSLTLSFTSEAPAREWAKRCGIDFTKPYEWSTQPYTSQRDGSHYTLINGWGTWHGANVRVNVLEPVPADAAAGVR